MSDKSRQDHEPSHGTAPTPGVSFDPKEGPEEGPPGAMSAPRSVSQGLPIDESEYRKLKKEAAKTPRPHAKTAQKDPSTTPAEDDG